MRALLLLLTALLSGCAQLGHWRQAATGHLALVRAARPVAELLASPATPPDLAERLRLTQRLRGFAVAELALPDSPSYTAYADLGRPAVVWNVVAAPADSLALHTWCYPLMGCAGYQGWFTRAAADRAAAALAAQGWEVQVQPIPAYSTLGFTRWLGGDPLLNTFITWPEGELAALLFHEMAHPRVYVADDTGFNESYAVAVELLGARQWLARRPEAAAAAAFEAGRQQRGRFLALAREGRARLAAAFARSPVDVAEKAAVLADLRARAPAEAPGYAAWFARANNASFAVLDAYDELVPAFLALFEREGRHWGNFHTAVERLAALPREQRRAHLVALTVSPDK